MTTTNPTTAVAAVGIDIGTESTKINLGPRYSCEIVRNSTGGHTLPTAASFTISKDSPRHIGETASLKGKNAVVHLNRLVNGYVEENDPFVPYYMFNRNSSDGTITVEYNGSSDHPFEPAALVAMLLGRIQDNVQATITRVSETLNSSTNTNTSSVTTPNYVISVPSGSSEATTNDLLDAAYAAGLTNVTIVKTSDCYATAYARKFPEHMDGRVVLVVDMGHTSTTISVIRMGKHNNNKAEEDVADAEGDAEKETKEDTK